MNTFPDGPHQHQPLVTAGADLEDAAAAVVLVHGRGASARSMLGFADALDQSDVAYLAPQAAGSTWYPHSFLAPLAQNEPGLSSGLQTIADLLDRTQNAGIAPRHTVLLGFSQGACLASEFVARHPQRYGGLVALSGGLIGNGEIDGAQPPDDKTFDYDGSLDGTPVFLGCSDRDPHIPRARVDQSAEVFRALGGDVTKRIYEGMGHTVNDDELRFARTLLREVVASVKGFTDT